MRSVLDEAFGGFTIQSPGPGGEHAPVLAEAVIEEDASAQREFVSLRVLVTSLLIDGRRVGARGAVGLTVSGDAAASLAHEWRAGRTIRAFTTFRRPARYLNEGVPDHERALALDGTSLFASIKSGLLVEVLANGTPLQERAAALRAHVRRIVAHTVGAHDPLAAAIVTAVLIGDRTGLPDDVRERLQAAGTYHVIAISGGNIAIFAGIVLTALACAGISGRLAAAIACAVLLAYSQVAVSGPSVWRATLMAVLYLGARMVDQRTPPWQATCAAAAAMVVMRPLDVRDAGFLLTFGATAALLEAVRLVRSVPAVLPGLGWVIAMGAASLAVEAALLPVSAQVFSRITCAGLLLNLLAVPAMAVLQIAGLLVVACDGLDAIVTPAAWIAYASATTLVESARLVDVAPWLARRVPPPGALLIASYYAALVGVLLARGTRFRVVAATAWIVSLLSIVSGGLLPLRESPSAPLRLTMFDVGQGEAILLEAGGRTLQIDAGGAPFGSGGFDIGARVLAPALWARGVRTLDTLLVTHGDPDHLGGALSLVSDFGIGRLWEGVEVRRHAPGDELRKAATSAGAVRELRRAGESFAWGGATIRVLHPPEPDWERPRVRNDDSVVIEVVVGDTALLLTGDVGADVERAILPQLTPARTRVLKVAHHGSRTSTALELVEGWRPHVALISAGRGNTFGHPAPEVVDRLRAVGAEIFRTDEDGQITLETDGRGVAIRTFMGRSYERR